MEEESAKEEIYDFAPEPRQVKVAEAVKKPNSLAPKPLAYRSKKEDQVDKADPETIKNIQMPMWLLAGGTAVEIIAAFLRDGGAAGALVDVGFELILGTAVMLGGILLAARLRQIDLGELRVAAFKLAAISVAPAAAVDLVYPVLRVIPLGGLLGLGAEFILYFALLGALFDLDESDTWYCVWIIFLVRLAFYFALLGVQARWG